MTDIDIICRLFGEGLHPSNHGESMATKTDAEFVDFIDQLRTEMMDGLLAHHLPVEKIKDILDAYFQALSHERQQFLPDPVLEARIGRRAAVYVRGCINDVDEVDGVLSIVAAHGHEKMARKFFRQQMKEYRRIMREESGLSPREIDDVCRVLPDAFVAEIRRRAVHITPLGAGPREPRD